MPSFELINGPYDGAILELSDNLGGAIFADGGISFAEPSDWQYCGPENQWVVAPAPKMCRYNDQGIWQIDGQPPLPEHWPLYYENSGPKITVTPLED